MSLSSPIDTFMKKPKQPVLLTVITILFLSNIILAYNFLQKSKEYEHNLNHLERNKVEFNTFVRKKQVEIDILFEQVKEKDSKIHSLREKLENATKEREVKTVNVSRGDSSNKKAYFLVTAYTAGYESTGKRPSHPAYGVTTSGTKVKEGRTLACPPSYPFGTKMKINGVGYRVCEDRGAAIKEGKLDLYIENLTRANNFGKQTLLVEILEEG